MCDTDDEDDDRFEDAGEDPPRPTPDDDDDDDDDDEDEDKDEEREKKEEEREEVVLEGEALVRAVEESLRLKEQGNAFYTNGEIDDAIDSYSQAILLLPRTHPNAAVLYANRAAAYYKECKYERVVEDATKCLSLNSTYTKALIRRLEAYEKLEKYAEAIIDIDELIKLQPSEERTLRARKERLVKDKAIADEKLKEEMMGKLKDLGNTLLGKFGLSTDNFKFVKDEKTGSYSVNFQQ